MKKIVLIILTLNFYLANAQDKNNRMEKIDTVKITAVINKNYSASEQQIIVRKLIISETKMSNLSNAISFINGTFIKEYGRGMLSTISLRGTDASHTQVVWNGIPVNSVLNGQVDMNTIYMGGYNYINLQKGGNSAEFGSGAIGGTIRLQDIKPNRYGLIINHQLQAGSFNTFRNNTTLVYQNKKFYTNISFQSNKSDNDYPFVGYDIKNDNGAYFGKDLSFILGYKFNKKNEFYYKSQANWLDREMSRSLYRPDQAKLLTDNQRYLLGWKYKSGKIKIRTDLANIYEKYQYFFDKNNDDSSDSRSNVWHLINTIDYQFTKNASFKLGNSLNFVEATGDAIAQHTRKQYAIYGVWKQKIKKISYQLKLRKEFTNDYEIPLIAGAGITFELKKNWITRANISTNYRVPTFNDLYWHPGGNPNLKPENSLSFDISQSYNYRSKSRFFDRTSLYLSAFYIRSHNLIKWQAVNNNFWQPFNIAESSSKGIEFGFDKYFELSYKYKAYFSASYTYQNVKDELTHKKLPYLPAQMFHGKIMLRYQKFTMRYQADFNDKIYTTSSNTQFMNSSLIHKVSLQYKINKQLSFEGKIDNIFNTFYQTMPSRPQPGRNYSININFKIHQYNEKK